MSAPPNPAAASLPHLLVLTDRRGTAGRPLPALVAAAVHGGAHAVILREKDLPTAERAELAAELRPVVHAAGGRLLIASDPTIAGDGVHLAAADPFPAGARPGVIGRSCHSLVDVAAAQAEGCDYVTLSPVFESASKPGYGPALGLQGLRDVADEVDIPIYALGGIDASIAAICLRAGARGVAVMGAVMAANDVEGATHALAHAVRDCDCAAGPTAEPATTGVPDPTVVAP